MKNYSEKNERFYGGGSDVFSIFSNFLVVIAKKNTNSGTPPSGGFGNLVFFFPFFSCYLPPPGWLIRTWQGPGAGPGALVGFPL